jgi:hypothetical protein
LDTVEDYVVSAQIFHWNKRLFYQRIVELPAHGPQWSPHMES